mgnify:CR=1 FL=1
MDNWIFCPKPNPDARLRLFCFPYAGAGAALFSEWPSALSEDVEVCALQLPGREMRFRESPLTDWQAVIASVVSASSAYLDKPFALFGYCVGSVLAFEMARALRREGLPQPFHLLVAARAAPTIPETEGIHKLSEAALIARLAETNATPEAILQDSTLLPLLLPVIRADFQIGETYGYVAEPPLACPISAFRGAKDKLVTAANITPWQAETTASFAVRTLPGDHFFINSARPIFLQMIQRVLT